MIVSTSGMLECTLFNLMHSTSCRCWGSYIFALIKTGACKLLVAQTNRGLIATTCGYSTFRMTMGVIGGGGGKIMAGQMLASTSTMTTYMTLSMGLRLRWEINAARHVSACNRRPF